MLLTIPIYEYQDLTRIIKNEKTKKKMTFFKL